MQQTNLTEVSSKRPRSRARSILRAAVILSAFALILGTVGTFYVRHLLLTWSVSPYPLTSPADVELTKGSSLTALSKQLQEKGLIQNWRTFRVWMRFFGSYDHFQAGPYRFEGAVSPQEIANAMMKGETYNPVVFQITVPEGATLRQISERLAEGGIGTKEEILKMAWDAELIRKLRVPSTSLEGFLYPATYPFSSKPSIEDVFTVMVEQFWKILPADYGKQVAQRGLDLHQAVTFASLIELETASDEERALVSEVIWSRFQKKIALGIDAAIIYGIPDYSGDITWKHLQDKKNPYNLRLHLGLPPTPIASPSLKSLLAVLNPSSLGYLYYVVDAENPSQHRFAKTITEHNKNVRQYVAKSKQR